MDPILWIVDEPFSGRDRDARVLLQEDLLAAGDEGVRILQDHTLGDGVPWRHHLTAVRALVRLDSI